MITRAPDEQKQIIQVENKHVEYARCDGLYPQTNSDKLALFKIAGISITYPDNCNEMSVSGPPDVTVEAIEFFSPAGELQPFASLFTSQLVREAAKRVDADSLSKAL